jgi:hypothetical protein
MSNSTGSGNAFFGYNAGVSNSTGTGNAFFGSNAGTGTSTGTGNTLIGTNASVGSNLTNATAIGAGARVDQSNSLVLGGVNVNVGIGTTAPGAKLHVEDGDVYIKSQNSGIILHAMDGPNCFRVTVNNAGALTPTRIDCP